MSINELYFINIIKYIFYKNYIFEIIIFICFGILSFLCKDLCVLGKAFFYYLMGFVIPISLHEYAHICCMRLFNVRDVEIKYSLLKISIEPKQEISGKELIVTALSGPMVCGVIGIMLFYVAIYIKDTFQQLYAFVYLIHFINLIPLFGDGRMVVKGLLTLKKDDYRVSHEKSK